MSEQDDSDLVLCSDGVGATGVQTGVNLGLSQQDGTVSLVRKENATSVVWDYFGMPSNYKTAVKPVSPVCRKCFNQVSAKGGNTSNLFHHIRDKHPELYNELKLSQNKLSKCDKDNLKLKSNTQPPIMDAINKSRPYEIDSIQAKKMHYGIAYFLCKDMLPLYTIERDGFKKMIKTIDARYKIPSRKYLQEKVISPIHLELVADVKSRLSHVNWYSMTTDMWTSRTMEAYMSLTVHYINDSWELECINLGAFPMNEDHTGTNIAEAVKTTLEDWELTAENIVAATTDSASNNKKAFSELNVKRLSCFGHNLDLAIKKSMSLPSVERAVKICRKAVEAFSRSWKRKRDLRRKQQELNLPDHRLIMDVCTRWGSTAAMISRFIEQQQAICAVFMENRALWHLNPSDSDYSMLEIINEVLGPLLEFTDMFSGADHLTISALYPVIKHLYDILEVQPNDNRLKQQIKEIILQDIKLRYNEPELKNTLMLCCLLDPRFKDLPFQDTDSEKELVSELKTKIISEAERETVQKEIIHKPVNLASCSSMTISPPAKKRGLSDIIKVVKAKYTHKPTGNEPNLSKITKELNTYLQNDVIDDDNSLIWWQNIGSKIFPSIAPVAKKYLCIPATSVPSERLFSGCGLIVTPFRNRLLPDNVNKMLFLGLNLK